MINFLKNFGKGVLYVLVLPFLLVGLALYGVIALFVFLFLAVKGLILFFSGRSLYEDLPEDKEAKRRLGLASGEKPQEATAPSVNVATTGDTQTANDPFYVPEYLKPEETSQDSEDAPTRLETFINENRYETPAQNNEEEAISAPKNPQNSNIFEVSDDDDDDDDNRGSGVDINFG